MIDQNIDKYQLGGCYILRAPSYSPCVVRTHDCNFIFSRNESGDISVLTDDQTVLNTLKKEDARRLALWILENY